jgi:glycosyltransferase involved in cell wall biosynthesis
MVNNMNILYIAHENSLGGATLSLLGIIDEMLIKNHKITVLVPGKEGELIEALKDRNVKVIKGRYYSWMSSSNGFTDKLKLFIKLILNFFYTLMIIRKIKGSYIEVIHTNSLVVNIGGMLKKRITSAVHVWHIREFGEEDHGLVFNFNRFRAYKYIENNSDAVVLISNSLGDKYRKYIDERKIHLIYNGVSLKYIQNEKSYNKGLTNILISGALKPGKGQEEAILAINELVGRGNENLILNIAGRGNTEYFKKLKAMVEKYSLHHNVIFLGQVNNISQLRAKMDVELVCSRSEAFGRVTIEAMMSMTPVIATNSGANPELIKHGENGLLYEQGDYHDLADKLDYLIKNSDLIKLYGRNGQRHAIKNYTSKNNAMEIECLYWNLIEKNNKIFQ